MFRRLTTSPTDDPDAEAPDDRVDDRAGAAKDPSATPDLRASLAPDLAALPIVGITRRRVAAALGVLLAVWLVFAFARQVGEASAAAARADEIAVSNVALEEQVAALDRELRLIAHPRYVEQQARGYGLGTAREIRFTLAPDAPPLAEDAPGSAAVRLGAASDDVAPLERWLTLLFGPTD